MKADRDQRLELWANGGDQAATFGKGEDAERPDDMYCERSSKPTTTSVIEDDSDGGTFDGKGNCLGLARIEASADDLRRDRFEDRALEDPGGQHRQRGRDF